MIYIVRGTIVIVALALALVGPSVVVAQDNAWPQRVLVTNDNGIEDVATQALARGFARIADVVLVAASEDRSGTSNLMTFTRTGRFVVERRDIGEGVQAWALDGYPADCVVFAAAGPMADAPPDLVVSGINGGANMSDEWFGSGTIGAARTAAFLGIPAIAVSGVEDDDPDAQAVSGKEVWSIAIEPRGQPGPESDVAVVARGRIAVVPMRVGDADPELLDWLRTNNGLLPAWQLPSRDR